MGDGQGDAVTIASSGSGGDHITTGTGQGDLVTVGPHTLADTFGFALGTNGTSYTTIGNQAGDGAQAGDHVVSGNNLGSHVVSEPGTFAGMSDFFNAVTAPSAAPASGNTYIGHSTTDTFIVTDYHGQFGAVDVFGTFNNSTVAGHTLTLA
jgi:hypothetical protein